MSRLTTRLDRLETQTQPRQRGRLLLHYVGEDVPVERDVLDLVLTLHRPGCATTTHEGLCLDAPTHAEGGHHARPA